jgi:hypothetical protein
MAKKMYYTEEEATAKLGVDAAILNNLVRDQKLRVFKDGARNMFRVDEVDALAEQGVPVEEEIELTPADTTGAGTISLADTAVPAAPPGKEDTVITAEGISIFDGEEAAGAEVADPLAKTQITMPMEEQVSADGSGSGSGLLDLTRESDDTSLGEVLDKIEMESGAPPVIEEAPAAVAAEPAGPALVEIPDPLAGLFNGLVVGCAVAGLVLAAVSLAAMYRVVPGFLALFADYKALVLAAFGVIMAVGGVVGHVVFKPASARGPGA